MGGALLSLRRSRVEFGETGEETGFRLVGAHRLEPGGEAANGNRRLPEELAGLALGEARERRRLEVRRQAVGRLIRLTRSGGEVGGQAEADMDRAA